MQEMERSKWLKQIPQESSEFIPTDSNFTPKGFSITKLFARRIYTLFFETKVITNPWVPSKYIKKGTFKKKVRLALWWKKKGESNYLPAGWGCAWIQTAAFTIHSTAALLGEAEFRRALTPKVLNTSHSSSGRGKKENFSLGIFVCLFLVLVLSLAPEKASKEQ